MASNNSNYPYWTPGWTAQHIVYGHDWQDDLGSMTSPAPLELPGDINLVTVQANYIDLSGRVFDSLITFTVDTQTNDSDGLTVLLPTKFKTWLCNGQLEVQLPAGFAYDVVEGMPGGRKYRIYIAADSPDTANLVDLVVSPGDSLVPLFGVGSDQWLINYAAGDLEALIVGTINRNGNGAITTADVVWPDGTPGVYTSLVFSSSFPGFVDSYKVTYVTDAVTRTVTQPIVTRDAGGAVTNRPEMVVS